MFFSVELSESAHFGQNPPEYEKSNIKEEEKKEEVSSNSEDLSGQKLKKNRNHGVCKKN